MNTYSYNMEDSIMQNKCEICNEKHFNKEAILVAESIIPNDAEINIASVMLKAVADPTRLRIVTALSGGELCVCDLCSIIHLSQSAVSHQLSVLRENKLVKSRRDGKLAFYSIDDEHVKELLEVVFAHVKETN